MNVDTPKLVQSLKQLNLSDKERYIADINKTKFTTGMASKHGNHLGVTILNHVKNLNLAGQLDNDRLEELIKTTGSEYLQRKSLGVFLLFLQNLVLKLIL